jgi:hypothetical protein
MADETIDLQEAAESAKPTGRTKKTSSRKK